MFPYAPKIQYMYIKTELNRADIYEFFAQEIIQQASFLVRDIPFSPLHLACGPGLLWSLLYLRHWNSLSSLWQFSPITKYPKK